MQKIRFDIVSNSNTGGNSKCCNCKGSIKCKEDCLQIIIGSQRFRSCLACAEDLPGRIKETLEEGAKQ